MKFGRRSLARVTLAATSEARNRTVVAKTGVVSVLLCMRSDFSIGMRLEAVVFRESPRDYYVSHQMLISKYLALGRQFDRAVSVAVKSKLYVLIFP